MKKLRKYLALLMACLMLVVLLSGCSSGGKSDNGSKEQPSGSEVGTVNDNNNADNDGWTGIGSADDPVEVSIILKDIFSDDEDTQALFNEIEKKMAAHGQYIDLVLLEPPASDYSTALALSLRSGELKPDIIYFQGGDETIADEGLLEDLTSYIENSTHVKVMLEEYNEERLENYPYLLYPSTPNVKTPVIRSDFAEQLDSYDALIEEPSVDNYYTFFKEMVDSGLVEYAFTTDGSIARLDSIFNHAFGVTGTIVQEDGKWIYSMASQAEKDKLEFYAKLYADGLLEPSYVTNTWDVMEQNFYDGKVGVISGTAGDVIQVYNTKMTSLNDESASLTVLPPASGVSQSYLSVDNTKESRGYAIHADSDVKEAAFAVLEFMASPEGRLLDKVGIEGIHYEIQDNQLVFTDDFASWWARIFPTPLNLNPEIPLAEPILSDAAQSSIDQVMDFYYADTNILIPEDMTAMYDAMTSLYEEYATNIVTGKADISTFDEFVEKFNEAGGDAFSDYFQEVLN